ncbi:hypothetical protein BST26_18675 [Mycolicibacterium insubricum]|uniref:Membrane transport protein MMPL domain-containing protein n=2 Tax=Mycolicibacterium insubricum TaxID=444597 RepID=A0A1X0CZ13_9MYCO|nr:MMPL family transporter [Mycolicibacterium insubricum]ORA65386.1 hypothetical protein BST26_18675 [Mycolicibacterium insubricum]
MFAWWGRMVYRFRYIVIGVMVALCLGGGVYGISLGEHVTQSGFYDDTSESVHASLVADDAYGRDRTSHVVAILTPPDDKKVTDLAWQKSVKADLSALAEKHKNQLETFPGPDGKPTAGVGWIRQPDADPATENGAKLQAMKTSDLRHTFITLPLQGNNDDEILKNYQKVEPDLRQINGGNVELAGLNPLASELTGTIAVDQQRAEVAAIPLVAILLFFVFGGVVAATLPAIIGGLSIAGALGIMRLVADHAPVHFFAQPVVTLIGLGIAIDYGLFIVSRFREEIAEGYDTEAAVRRTVMTSGRTVMFSAVIIVASSLPLLLFPQGFLKSITYAIIASVMLSAILSITVLAAILAILGPNVDALGVNTLLRVPFLRNWSFSRRLIDWFAAKTQKTKTREEVENGFWGRLVNMVMKRPLTFAIPILIFMVALIIPLGKLTFAGISEKYLPPDNSVRMAQEHFDQLFPTFRTAPLTLVIESTNGQALTDAQVNDARNQATKVSGFVPTEGKLWQDRGTSKNPNVRVLQNGLEDSSSTNASNKIAELREDIHAPAGTRVSVGGTPALEQDSIHSLFAKLPLMVLLLITTTTVLMFLAFGSLVLPIKAALMSALTLGSTMGVLSWMFIEGHGAGLMNYTPQPLMAPMIGLIIAVIYGLSTDYEVFLVSRMVEARERGMSTAESIRIGTATTGRLITAAALVLAVVAGAFVFSDLVMMKYLAFGLLIALLLDATIIRMFLVPAIMKLLGDDCWWAPRWMKVLQVKLGLGETHLPDERKSAPVRTDAPVGAGPVGALTARAAGTAPPRPQDPTHPGPSGPTPVRKPVPPRETPSASGTARMPAPDPVAQAPTSRIPDPTAEAAPPARPGPPPARQTEDAPTTRFAGLAGARNAVRRAAGNAMPRHQRPPAPAAAPEGGERQIESWLGELRGKPAGPPSDADAATTALPVGDDPATRAIPKQTPGGSQEGKEPETARLDAPGEHEDNPTHRGGGVSAQDLLRREGRL